jgi:chemotaxis protein CheZ
MPAQRKVFRIEEMLSHDAPVIEENVSPSAHAEILAEIRSLRAAIEQAPAQRGDASAPLQDARRLKIELDVIGTAIKQTRSEILSLQDQGFDSSRVARVTKELDAVFSDTTTATDKILKAAEQIDECVTALMPTLANKHSQGLAADIQDKLSSIFEACNFHDLTGQRITRVTATLKLVEDHLARMMEIWSVIDRFNVEDMQGVAGDLDGLLNGPRVDGDAGHSTQDEIDAMFR